MIIFGFSTGCLHKHFRVKQALAFYSKLGLTAVELDFYRKIRIDQGQLAELTVDDLTNFSYVSFHAPIFDYGDNQQTREIFKKIEHLHQQRPLDLVLFHPDGLRDFKLFDDLSFPVGIENMDNHKDTFQTVEEMEKLLAEHPNFKVVLDINHIFTIDPTMKLIKSFYERVGTSIAELHVSGHDKDHKPFIETRQENIIKAIGKKSTPMIDEAVMSPEMIEPERDYFLKVLNS